MKPIFVYVKSDDDKDVVIPKETFEKLIQDAYNQGYCDGAQSQPSTINWRDNRVTCGDPPPATTYGICTCTRADTTKDTRATTTTTII